MSNEVGDVHGHVVQAGHVDRIDLHPITPPTTALYGLPPVTTIFRGRTAELAALRSRWAEEGPAVISSAVGGLAGIGKTELVLHAAHQAAEDGDFPGGVLFIDLQGYDEARRVTSVQALDSFLRALGVDSRHIPPAEDQRSALYRSILNSRQRMLIVLDNASSTAQVRPLLPGSRHRVAITSRHTLSGLDEAHHLELGLLDETVATELVGDARLAALCGRLPLALRIMRALIKVDPHTEWATELADAGHRLDLLDDGDSRAVHAAFDLSYRSLDEEQRRLFRLLSFHPTDEFPLEGAVALADRPLSRTRVMLRELVRAHLIEPGADAGWFTFHDLVRLYASYHAKTDCEADVALSRMMVHYSTKANLARKHRSAGDLPRQTPFSGRDDAAVWLDRTWAVLTETARLAAERGQPAILFPLVRSLWSYFEIRWHPKELLEVCELALNLAQSTGDRAKEAKMLAEVGNVHVRTRQFTEAIVNLERSLALYRTFDDDFGLAGALNDLGSAYRRAGRPSDALVAYTEALAIREAIADWRGIGQTLNNLGNAERDNGNPTSALAWYEKALDLRRRMGDDSGVAQTHNNIATVLLREGDLEEAISRHAVALRTYRKLGEPNREAGTLYSLGRALLDTDQRASAETALQEALSIFERLGAVREAQEVRDLLSEA
ncbi:tetratricopeptide repeat protein [Lentzea sp. NPDC058436]|uniref:tetratricopeptide repeat protein n=1 Tax=Lentzea sp. NPDC058436 TaxID=3346499 RepID=UPI0036631FCE